MKGLSKCRTFVQNLECVILEASILLKPQEGENSKKNELKMYLNLPKSVDFKQSFAFQCERINGALSYLNSNVISNTNIKTIIL